MNRVAIAYTWTIFTHILCITYFYIINKKHVLPSNKTTTLDSYTNTSRANQKSKRYYLNTKTHKDPYNQHHKITHHIIPTNTTQTHNTNKTPQKPILPTPPQTHMLLAILILLTTYAHQYNPTLHKSTLSLPHQNLPQYTLPTNATPYTKHIQKHTYLTPPPLIP